MTETTTEPSAQPAYSFDGIHVRLGDAVLDMIEPQDPNAANNPSVIVPGVGPRPIQDLLYEQQSGQKLKHGTHYESVGGIKTAPELHKRYMTTPLRGRRPHDVELHRVRAFRKSFFAGKSSARQIAAELGWSEQAVRNMLNGVTYWYA